MAYTIIPELFLMALVSQYDAFLSRLLRCIFLKKPTLLNDSDKQLSYSEVIGFGSIKDAKEFVLEKEVEAVIRRSHAEHFQWMETKFGVQLRKDLPIWPVFIELMERRNLIAHTNGIVSSQYLAVCKQHGVSEGKLPEVGSRLSVTQPYMKRAFNCLYEIGTKLAYVLWRKLFADEIKDADNSIVNVIFELIATERYPLAITLGSFCVEVYKKWGTDELKLFMKINLAQAYKWKGSPDKCKEIMQGEDWTARGNNLKQAFALLSDDFEEAIALMRRIGANGEIKEHDYKEWPIFKELRKRPKFLEVYKEIFGKEFVPVEKIVTRVIKKWGEVKVDHVFEEDLARTEDPADDYTI